MLLISLHSGLNPNTMDFRSMLSRFLCLSLAVLLIETTAMNTSTADPDCQEESKVLQVKKTVTLSYTLSKKKATDVTLEAVCLKKEVRNSTMLHKILCCERKSNICACSIHSDMELWCKKNQLVENCKVTTNKNGTITYSVKITASAVDKLPEAVVSMVYMAEWALNILHDKGCPVLKKYSVIMIEQGKTTRNTTTGTLTATPAHLPPFPKQGKTTRNTTTGTLTATPAHLPPFPRQRSTGAKVAGVSYGLAAGEIIPMLMAIIIVEVAT